MNNIVNKISFFMQEGKNPAEAMIYLNSHAVHVTEEQLDTVLHPSSKWELHMEFDDRSLDIWDPNIKIKRVERFEAYATLRDMLKRIVRSKCYGFIEYIHGVNGVFHLEWGT